MYVQRVDISWSWPGGRVSVDVGSHVLLHGAGGRPLLARVESIRAEEALATAELSAGAAVAAEEEASAARKVAEAAASAAVDPMAVAAATTVWIAFDGIPPPEEVQTVLQGNRGVWLPSAVPEHLQTEPQTVGLEARSCSCRPSSP